MRLPRNADSCICTIYAWFCVGELTAPVADTAPGRDGGSAAGVDAVGGDPAGGEADSGDAFDGGAEVGERRGNVIAVSTCVSH